MVTDRQNGINRVSATGVEHEMSREIADRISEALQGIRFGTITLVIQDGKIIQIDRSEKIRLK